MRFIYLLNKQNYVHEHRKLGSWKKSYKECRAMKLGIKNCMEPNKRLGHGVRIEYLVETVKEDGIVKLSQEKRWGFAFLIVFRFGQP